MAVLVGAAACAGLWAQAAAPVPVRVIGGSGAKEHFEKRRVPPLAAPAAPGTASFGQNFVSEVEPNSTRATATPLGGTNVVAAGNVYPISDVDYWSFTASANDRVFIATMSAFSPAGASTDTSIALVNALGGTIEIDDDDGSFSPLSSSIAGRTLPTSGTYYIRVSGVSFERVITPYHLHVRVQSGSPMAESEDNGETFLADPLPASGYASGVVSSAADQDIFRLSLLAGATISMSLDLDPERNGTTFDGRLSFGLVGGAFLGVDDDGSGDGWDSEALFMTVLTGGTYYVMVDSGTGTGVGAGATYRLSVSTHPTTGGTCTTYASTDVPKAIANGGTATSTLAIPGPASIDDVYFDIEIDHAAMTDLDVVIRAPSGNDVGLFTDAGSDGLDYMNTRLHDGAGIPIVFRDAVGNQVAVPIAQGIGLQPDHDFRTGWFRGQEAGGTWTLTLRDDNAGNGVGGTLAGWSVTVCTPPPPTASCPPGSINETILASDFELDNGGFTATGTSVDWAWGDPSAPPIDTCHSGINCWKTGLAGGYGYDTNQDLLSPVFDLTSAWGPVTVTWWQRFQMEGASFDHAWAEINKVGPGLALKRRLWEFRDGTMYAMQGTTVVMESGGWARVTADVTVFAGVSAQLVFHLDSDDFDTHDYAGLAIDDVAVTACIPVPKEASNLMATKSGTVVDLTYTPASCATDHAVYWGTSPIAGSLSWVGSACGLGTSGTASFNLPNPPPNQVHYFVVVGNSPYREGSYGLSSALAQRPEAVGIGSCDRVIETVNVCP